MIEVSIDFKTALAKELGKIGAQNGLKVAADIVVAEAQKKEITPVDTGYLRRSIHADLSNLSNLEVNIVASAEYAAFVHNGTSRKPARPFLKKAINNKKGSVVNIVESFIRNEMNK